MSANHRPFDALINVCEAGQTLEVVLPAFTSNVAQLLHLPRKGYLRYGFDADLVVLSETGEAQAVMSRGAGCLPTRKTEVL